MSRLSRHPVLVAALAVAAMIWGACASSGRAPSAYAPRTLSPPQDREQARRQLAYYTRQLVRGRRGLGFGGPAATAGAALSKTPARVDYGGMKPARRAPERHAVKAPTAAKPMAKRTAPSPSPASPPPRAHSESADSTADGGHYRRRQRCPMPCRHARAICHAARRICSIADYLGEDDAKKRCSAAREDCKRARESTRDRCDSVCPSKPA